MHLRRDGVKETGARLSLQWLVPLVLMGTSPTSATACTCMPLDVKRVAPELEQATHVFVGRVTAVEPPAASEPSSFRRSRVTFAVARRWKGPEGPSYTVAAGPLSVADTCVARFT